MPDSEHEFKCVGAEMLEGNERDRENNVKLNIVRPRHNATNRPKI